ncbi:MAG: hypothetical protein ACRBCJ_04905 [Hyphomicrobiaceae bacterium]
MIWPPRWSSQLTSLAGAGVVFTALACVVVSPCANAQSPEIGGWETDLDVGVPFPEPPNTTVIPRSVPKAKPKTTNSGLVAIKLLAFLTADGQQIDRGLVWRIFTEKKSNGGRNELVATKKTANPTVRLKPGTYLINASFGRAHLTRKFVVSKNTPEMTERFVINAGGLRLNAVIGNTKAARTDISFDIYEGERNQSGERDLVLTNAKPNLITRLNAGIYHIVSTYGDANAKVAADVTVEAGKLTQATISHAAARVTFKLVTHNGGEAQPGTEWTVKTQTGEIVKRSVGALPTHILAPGKYLIIGRQRGRDYQREFQVVSGEKAEIEVLIQ